MSNSNITCKTSHARGKASTFEILGKARTPQPVQRKWAEHHRKLSDLRTQLSEEKRIGSENAQEQMCTFSEHMADAATDSYDRDCALALLSSAQRALYEIEAALSRIANGTYGICELTGEPIESDRLKMLPWTRFSKAAQLQIEARHHDKRVHLGELGSCCRPSSDDEIDDDETVAEPTRERQPA